MDGTSSHSHQAPTFEHEPVVSWVIAQKKVKSTTTVRENETKDGY